VTASGTPGVVNGIVRRDADGAYTAYGELEELLIFRLRAVENDGALRFYQGALRGEVTTMVDDMEVIVPNYMIRVSDDEAETFREFPIVVPEGSFNLLGVDPTNPDRIVALINRSEDQMDDVLVSDDQGETFEVYMQISNFGAIAFAPDGRVWIGEKGVSTLPDSPVGLWFAESLDVTPTEIADYPVSCLGYQPATDTLYACQRREFGTVAADGAFTELFHFLDVEEFVSCDGVDMAQMCKVPLCRDYCTFGHFARAPLCEAYEDPTCGVCVAAIERDEPGPAFCSRSGLGSSGSGGSGGGSAGSGGTGTGSGGSGGGSAGSGGSSGDSGGGGSSGCSLLSQPEGRRGGMLLLLAAGVLLALRRRTLRG
jgi:hypothetical protein